MTRDPAPTPAELLAAARFMSDLIDRVYGTDNEGMDFPEEAEYRHHRAVIERTAAALERLNEPPFGHHIKGNPDEGEWSCTCHQESEWESAEEHIASVVLASQPAAATHQHIGPLGSVTCYAAHAEPPHDLVPRSQPAAPDPLADPEPIANETESGYARRRELVVEARAVTNPVPTPTQALRAAAKEMLDYIDAYEDAMGHGYCATQSGDYMDSCTCGFQDMHDRWQAALAAAYRDAKP